MSLITQLQSPLYHGSTFRIDVFKIPPHGVFFSPHLEWAESYGSVITEVEVQASRIYLIDYKSADDEQILSALFDRDYKTLSGYISALKSIGYQACQTITDSEMVCVFPGTIINVLSSGGN